MSEKREQADTLTIRENKYYIGLFERFKALCERKKTNMTPLVLPLIEQLVNKLEKEENETN